MKLEEITAKLEALQTKADEAVSSEATSVEEAKALLDELKPQVETLTAERESALQAKAVEDIKGELTTLNSVIAELRKPSGTFTLETDDEGKSLDASDPYAGGTFSYFQDVKLADRGDAAARERLSYGFEGLNAEGKAMTEGTNNQGGYLVRPQIERQLVLARESDNIIRGLCSSVSVNSSSIQLDQLGLTTSAGWVAELASKPESSSYTSASITASVFVAAGLATISNQLLADADPAVDQLATQDLAKRIVALEEAAFINGSGSGQPLGILGTAGIGATALTATDIPSLLDAILDAIAGVETNHGSPSAIVMHPRTWTRILKSKDTQGAYYVDPTGGPQDPRTGFRGPLKVLWGVPVYTSNRVPTNLGAGTNESRVIVGDFKEALILDRQGITVDSSAHVGFTTNSTVFRAEERVGFTAARTPLAFNVVGGAGLAAG